MVLTRSQREGRFPIWRLLPENQELELQEGDRVKLGRVELYLKEIAFINSKKLTRFVTRNTSSRDSRGNRISQLDSPLKNSGYFSRYQLDKMRDSLSMKQSDYLMERSGVSQVSAG